MLALAAGSIACASSGAVPKPFPMPDKPSPGPKEGPPATPSTEPASPPSRSASGRSGHASLDGYALVGTALALRGAPYRNGGSDPNGFDCSGFTQYVFGQYGVSLPRAVREQFRSGKPVKPEDLAPGDLVFFATTEPGVSHVAIAIGGDEFVHAPSSSGVVRVEHLGASYWSQRFVGVRRLEN
jgi:cell wall-associated NlpC family hydrolase